jgi:hypothetical protein
MRRTDNFSCPPRSGFQHFGVAIAEAVKRPHEMLSSLPSASEKVSVLFAGRSRRFGASCSRRTAPREHFKDSLAEVFPHHVAGDANTFPGNVRREISSFDYGGTASRCIGKRGHCGFVGQGQAETSIGSVGPSATGQTRK